MKRSAALACSLALCFCSTLSAQNPVASALRGTTTHSSKDIIDAAEAFPADKYGYKPTPAQMSVADVVVHLAGGNLMMCSWITGAKAPESPKLTATDSKEKLVAWLKDSFTFCSTSFASLDDSKLSDSIPFFMNMKMTRAMEEFIYAVDLADHYSQLAIYMRLNGLTPPSAKRKEM